jgi:hypothetical protein
MARGVGVAMFMALGPAAIVAAPQTLRELTVPAAQLPEECRLVDAPSRTADGEVRGGLWAGLRISSNPWMGSDPAVIAAIRERMEPPADVPDGPPLSPVERARFRLRLADGVESAYAAVYGDTADRLTIVLGLKHTNDPHVAVKVSPAAGACADAVGVHVKTVTQR